MENVPENEFIIVFVRAFVSHSATDHGKKKTEPMCTCTISHENSSRQPHSKHRREQDHEHRKTDRNDHRRPFRPPCDYRLATHRSEIVFRNFYHSSTLRHHPSFLEHPNNAPIIPSTMITILALIIVMHINLVIIKHLSFRFVRETCHNILGT